jgi:hypothetical protein
MVCFCHADNAADAQMPMKDRNETGFKRFSMVWTLAVDEIQEMQSLLHLPLAYRYDPDKLMEKCFKGSLQIKIP